MTMADDVGHLGGEGDDEFIEPAISMGDDAPAVQRCHVLRAVRRVRPTLMGARPPDVVEISIDRRFGDIVVAPEVVERWGAEVLTDGMPSPISRASARLHAGLKLQVWTRR